MDMKLLVTGSSGQIGSELTDALRGMYGSENVLATDLKVDVDAAYSRKLDVTDAQQVISVMRDYRPDLVVHLAAILSAKGELFPEIAFQVNAIGFKNVLDACLKCGVNRLFFPSTIAVFGPTTPRQSVPSDTITWPTTIYGITKLFSEQIGEYYWRRYGLDVRSMRLPGIISYRTKPGGGTTDYAVEMLMAASRHLEYTCFLKEDTVLPMMYMPDALAAILKLISVEPERLIHRTNFNVSSFSISPASLADEIRKYVPDFRVHYSPDERQKIAETWPCTIDSSDASAEWGFSPEYGVEETVNEMMTHLKDDFEADDG